MPAYEGLRRGLPILGLLAVIMAGCEFLGLDEADDTKPPIKKNVTSPPPTTDPRVSETVQPTLQLKIGEGHNVRVQDCYVRLIPAASDRPAVLQIASYASPETESFPSIFISANAPADDMKAIVGQSLTARIFITDKQEGTVWHTADDVPANITVRNADDAGRVTGTIIDGVLHNSSTSTQTPVSGRFDGKLQR